MSEYRGEAGLERGGDTVPNSESVVLEDLRVSKRERSVDINAIEPETDRCPRLTGLVIAIVMLFCYYY